MFNFSFRRQFTPQEYHVVQEIQKFNVPDYRPAQAFKKAVEKIRNVGVMKRHSLGYAFSQSEGQTELIRKYDTTKAKPSGF